MKRRAKYKFKVTEGQKISKMAKSYPKAFWKDLKKQSKSHKVNSEKLTLVDFFQHFSDVFGGEEAQNDRNLNLNFDLQSNEQLDTEISQREVWTAIKSLAPNKSPDMDDLIPEIFKADTNTNTPFITVLLNTIFKSKIYPQSWTKSYVTPILKKGDVDITNNYRGIALINITAKLYSKLLHDRLMKWAVEKD